MSTVNPASSLMDSTTSISQEALSVLQADAQLPICKACGCQFPTAQVSNCLICEDPRQFVPESGQAWTSLSELWSQGYKNIIQEDKDDKRLKFISTEPAFAINQNPILIETAEGSYIWDCAALITPQLVASLSTLQRPLKAIAISHPHFFSTSLVWSRALKVPLYICKADEEWFVRRSDIKSNDHVIFWEGERELGPDVSIIQCGGHFPGSSVLYWDRLQEPAPTDEPTKPTLVSGLLLVSDTVMVQPTQRGFTFQWSVPNLIPLDPLSILQIRSKLQNISFGQATSSWPGRFIRENAKNVFLSSVNNYLSTMGWQERDGKLVPEN